MTLRWPVAVVVGFLLVSGGAAATFVLLRSDAPGRDGSGAPEGVSATSPVQPTAKDSSPTASRPLPDVMISLSDEALQRARIRVAPANVGAGAGSLRLAAIVEPNAYKQVVVTPVVGGRVTRVLAELGAAVRQGQAMAQVFSPELSEAQSRYISARAELEAHERELERTEKLAKIGAASVQELERIHAEHTSKESMVDSAQSRLQLLGLRPSVIDGLASGKGVDASVDVPAPIAGVVTERLANVGLNVDPATKLFTVVDMSHVWVVADLFEKDFSRVRVGDAVNVTTTAYPDLQFKGRINYIDPQLNAQTRTAKVRVEVPNPRGELRLGMFTEVAVDTSDQASVILVPRSAVQNVGDRVVVYVANPKQRGQFIERDVRLGQQTGDLHEVLSGVAPGDSVVVDGSFFLRAERERLGLRSPSASTPSPTATPASRGREQGAGAGAQTAKIIVGEQGYEPAKVTLRAGAPARLTFVRVTDNTCGTEVVFPSLNIERVLPLNEPVVIEFTPAKSGDIAFACGMGMLHGTVVVH
jgi:cobalt-zinc-cadmium efflux system membrane fusion protein